MFFLHLTNNYCHVTILLHDLPNGVLCLSFRRAIGAGAVRSNIIAFGADQVHGLIVKSRYIDKFVVAIHVGSVIMISMSIIIPNDARYFFHFYTIGASMLFVSALLFFMGWPYYMHVNPYDSVVINCIPVTMNAFRTWRAHQKNKPSIHRRDINVSTSNLTNSLDSAPSQEIDTSTGTTHEQRLTFLDFAKVVNNGNFNDRIVEDVKSFRNAIIILALILPYKIAIYQVQSIVFQYLLVCFFAAFSFIQRLNLKLTIWHTKETKQLSLRYYLFNLSQLSVSFWNRRPYCESITDI